MILPAGPTRCELMLFPLADLETVQWTLVVQKPLSRRFFLPQPLLLSASPRCICFKLK